MTKFFDKSKLPDQIVAYEYMEDTELPFIKKITSVSKFKGTFVRFICEPIKGKGKKISIPKFFDYDGNLDHSWSEDWGFDIKSGSYFKHNDAVYKIDNEYLREVTNYDSMGDALKAALGVIETNMNEAFEFLSFLEYRGVTLHVIGQWNLIAVFPGGKVWEMGRAPHGFYVNDLIDIVTNVVDTKKITRDVLIKNYKTLEEFANSYGRHHDKQRDEYEEFKRRVKNDQA